MSNRTTKPRSRRCVVIASVALAMVSAAESQTLDERFQKLVAPSPDGTFVASPEEVAVLMRQAIVSRDTQFLIGLLWTSEKAVGRQALRAIDFIPTQEKYVFLSLMVVEDSFWRNLNYETDSAAEIQALQQSVVVEGVKGMIQQEVSTQDFYDEPRRRELQRIVADVVKNGLPNRDPNWKPKEFVGDPSPKKAITIQDPFKKQTNVLTQTPMPPSTPPDNKANVRSEAVAEAPKHSRSAWIAVASVALLALAAAAWGTLKKRK